MLSKAMQNLQQKDTKTCVFYLRCVKAEKQIKDEKNE